ncbi:hypothetical protein AHAS_Ahas17G0247700 [Arachis hypogaea]
MSNPPSGDMLQSHKMIKTISWDIAQYPKMIHVIMLMDQNQRAFNSSYSTYQEPSSLEGTFNSFMQNCPTSPPSFSFENSSSLDYVSTQSFLQDPYNSFHQPQNSLHYTEDSFQHPQNSFHNS